MRLVPAFALLAFATPAFAAQVGLATDHFEQTWMSLQSGRFTAVAAPVQVRTLAVHTGTIPAQALAGAFESAADDGARRDLALDEMASAWHQVQRTALEDLRDARRAYAATSGADATAKEPRFIAMLQQVVAGSGRSVAHDADGGGETVLADGYRHATEALPDADLQGLQASERAWIAYRDAFGRFARAVDRPDATREVEAELSRARAAELTAEAPK